MKKDIVICCEAMLKAIANRDVVPTWNWTVGTPKDLVIGVTIRERSGSAIKNCPWCSKELPFPYEEEK